MNDRIGKKDDYSDIKMTYNDLVLGMEDQIREEIETSSDPVAKALVMARIGNYIDFGAMNHVDTYTIAVQSYADTLLDAAVLSTIARHYMEDMISDPDIASVRFNTDYNFTDTTTKRYRYQALFDITEL